MRLFVNTSESRHKLQEVWVVPEINAFSHKNTTEDIVLWPRKEGRLEVWQSNQEKRESLRYDNQTKKRGKVWGMTIKPRKEGKSKVWQSNQERRESLRYDNKSIDWSREYRYLVFHFTVIWVGIFSSRDIFKKVLTVSRII